MELYQIGLDHMWRTVMNNRIEVIVDTSGSITENGKSAVVKYMLYTIKNLCERDRYGKFKVEIFGWAERIMPINSISELVFKGTLSAISFEDHIKDMDDNCSIIIVTDGNFDLKTSSVLKNRNRKDLKIYCIAVGADADTYGLKKISTYPEIFTPENITKAILTVCGQCEVKV